MRFGGFQEFTLSDFPGRVAAIVFVLGCNMDCYYCQNRDLINEENFKKSGRKEITEKEIFEFLEKNRKMLDGVVITGGEGLIEMEIIDFMKKLKDMGFDIKIDTNGTDPKLLEYLIKKKLVDYIAMDIKAPLAKYQDIIRVPIDTNIIKKSIDLIMNSKIEHEFRTTLSNKLEVKDYQKMGELINGDKWFLQRNIYETPSIDVYKFLKENLTSKDKDYHYREGFN